MACSLCKSPTARKIMEITVPASPDPKDGRRTITLCDQCLPNLLLFLLGEHQAKSGISPVMALEQFARVRELEKGS